MDADIVTDLDNYCDYIHHSGEVCREILTCSGRTRPADGGKSEETLASWREFVYTVNYDKFWDEEFLDPVECRAR